ncbi:MAG TPA: GNAT family N-acetyltransferase [Allosphingosinicella sp.]|jgi:putative acetyltransferase
MHVRTFRPDDAPFLARIFHAAVHQIGKLHYTAEQVGAWAPTVPTPETFLRQGRDGRLLLVAVDHLDHPLAYGDLEADGHIDHLYCRPDIAGTGVTSFLYDRIEEAAVARGIGRLFVEASEAARRFFLKKDFVELRRREINLGDVAIHNFEMEKRLMIPGPSPSVGTGWSGNASEGG